DAKGLNQVGTATATAIEPLMIRVMLMEKGLKVGPDYGRVKETEERTRELTSMAGYIDEAQAEYGCLQRTFSLIYVLDNAIPSIVLSTGCSGGSGRSHRASPVSGVWLTGTLVPFRSELPSYTDHSVL
ncbi:16574_t:CDS:2, partial [Acaulospora colombiana]